MRRTVVMDLRQSITAHQTGARGGGGGGRQRITCCLPVYLFKIGSLCVCMYIREVGSFTDFLYFSRRVNPDVFVLLGVVPSGACCRPTEWH